MANKKFKRFITGILLSCNIASFSFCSANYDVLTEAIANQSGSEKLKALYDIGAKKMQRPYAEESERLRIEHQPSLNEICEQIKICKKLQEYYQNLFKDCCDPQKLKTLRDELETSLKQDEIVLDCYTTRFRLSTCPKNTQNIKLLDKFGKVRMIKLLLNDPKYHFVYIVNFLKFSGFTPVGFANELGAYLPELVCELDMQTLYNLKQKLTNQSDGGTTKQIINDGLTILKTEWEEQKIPLKKLNSTQQTKLKTTILPAKISATFFSMNNIPKKQTWEKASSESLKQVSEKIQNYLKKALQHRESQQLLLTQKIKIKALLKAKTQIEMQPADIKCLDCRKCESTLTKTNTVKAYTTFTKLRDFTNGGNVARGIGAMTIDLKNDLPKIKVLEENEHLSAHFEQKKFIESNTDKRYYGKFNVENSIFFSKNNPMNVSDLLDLPLNGNKTVIISAYKTEHQDKGNRNNYVFYIYDYDKYGFVKTGEIYGKDTKKWYPAYAIMFVTNEKNELITVYPLYM